MLVFTLICWVFKCVFSCNHARTPVNEGKCFCPDCGRGLIYEWILLRCGICGVRLDSRQMLRQVVPAQRCCAFCGEREVLWNVLEAPAVFQLHKARLRVREEADPLSSWLGFETGFQRAIYKTLAWLEPAPPIAKVYLPVCR